MSQAQNVIYSIQIETQFSFNMSQYALKIDRFLTKSKGNKCFDQFHLQACIYFYPLILFQEIIFYHQNLVDFRDLDNIC